MKILITGGAGFIGSNIADALLAEGHDILIIDNFVTGSPENIDKKCICYDLDINSEKTRTVFQKYKPEIVIHNAAQVSVKKSIEDPLIDQITNITGTINILENCVRNGVRKIIYPSSAAVYGVPSYLPTDENHPINPESYYGLSKHVPEDYIKIYSKLNKLDYTILRYSNVYGPRQDHRGEGGVVSVFINTVLKNENLMIFGDGNQTRDFIYVKDIVSANIAALQYGSGRTLNISSNTTTTLNDLVDVMKEIIGHDFAVNYREERPGDLRNSQLDNTRAKSELNWGPNIQLIDGLRETFDFYKNEIMKLMA